MERKNNAFKASCARCTGNWSNSSVFLLRYVAVVGKNPCITPYPAVLVLPKSPTSINPQQLETRAPYMNWRMGRQQNFKSPSKNLLVMHFSPICFVFFGCTHCLPALIVSRTPQSCFYSFTETKSVINMMSNGPALTIHLKRWHHLCLFIHPLHHSCFSTLNFYRLLCESGSNTNSPSDHMWRARTAPLMTNQLEQFFFTNNAHHPLPQMQSVDFTSQYGQHLEITEHNVLQYVLYSSSNALL